MLSTHLVIGEILKPQGIRGEVKVRPITCDPDRFSGLETVYFEENGAYRPVRVHVNRMDEAAVYMSFEGADDRNAAEALRGKLVYIDRAHAVELPEDTEFICDLVGCRGRDETGRDLGELTEVLQPGGNDVYVFHGPLGEVLVPALKSAVTRVDVENKEILFDSKRLSEVAVFED